jgi:RpiR family carbohydrate utilization transcriptional regulator
MDQSQQNIGNALSRLRGFMPSLSPAEKKVGEYTLSNPDQVLQMTLNDIAEQTGVSNATALRFCYSLGYESWLALKFALVQSLPNAPRLYGDNPNKKDKNGVITRKVLLRSMQAIDDTLAIMEDAKIDQAVGLIRKARRILIVSAGTSAPIALEMQNRLLRLGLNCHMQTDSYLQGMQVALLGPKDLLIVISQTGNSSDPKQTAAEAQARGVPILCLTGNTLSPIGQFLNVVLLSVTQESNSEALSSRVAQYAMVHALYVCLAMRSMDQTHAKGKQNSIPLKNKTPIQGKESHKPLPED